jgi:hypothetical protein
MRFLGFSGRATSKKNNQIMNDLGNMKDKIQHAACIKAIFNIKNIWVFYGITHCYFLH